MQSLDDSFNPEGPQQFTPRSMECILSLGFSPGDLFVRHPGTFRKAGEDEHFAQRRFEHWEKKRKAHLSEVKQARKNMMHASTSRPNSRNVFAQSQADNDEKAMKIALRTRKGLQNSFMYEVRRQQQEALSRKRMAEAKAREEALKAERRKKKKNQEKKQLELEQHQRELLRQEELARKKLAVKMYEENQRKIAREKEQARIHKLEIARAEQARIEREAKRRAETEEYNRQLAEKRAQKQEDMARRDKERSMAMEEKKKQKEKEAKEASIRREMKLAAVAAKQQEILEKQREDFEANQRAMLERYNKFIADREHYYATEAAAKNAKKAQRQREILEQGNARLQARVDEIKAKEAKAEKKRKERQKKAEAEAEMQRQRDAEAQRKRDAKIQQARDLAAKRVEEINEKRRLNDERGRRLAIEKEKKLALKKLEEALAKEDKQAHVERIKRQQEHHKAKMLEKVKRTEARMKQLKLQQAQMRKKRLESSAAGERRRIQALAKFAEVKDSLNLMSVDASDFKNIDWHAAGLPKELIQIINPSKEADLLMPPDRDSDFAPSVSNSPKRRIKRSSPKKTRSPQRVPVLPTEPLRGSTPKKEKKQIGSGKKSKPKSRSVESDQGQKHVMNPHFEDMDSSSGSMNRSNSQAQIRTPQRQKGSKRILSQSMSVGTLPSSSKRKPMNRTTPVRSKRKGRKARSGKRKGKGRRRKTVKTAAELTIEEKEHIIEELAAEQNAYLLMILEKEQETEHEREKIMLKASDPAIRQRYEQAFNIERAQAREIIKAITREHETTLALKMEELHLLSEEDADTMEQKDAETFNHEPIEE